MTLNYPELRSRIARAVDLWEFHPADVDRIVDWATNVVGRHQPIDRSLSTNCYVCGFPEPCPDVLAVARAFGVAYD